MSDSQSQYGQTQVLGGSFVSMRLETSSIIKKIEEYLRGTRERIMSKEDGTFLVAHENIGKPRANDEGVNGILNMIEMRVNPHTIQGNFKDEDQYDNYRYHTRIEITRAIVINRVKWNINDQDMHMIIDDIMGFISLVMTRPLDNKERDSYNQQVHTHERVGDMEKDKKKFMGFSR